MKVITKIHEPATPPTGQHIEISVDEKTVGSGVSEGGIFFQCPSLITGSIVFLEGNKHFLLSLAEDVKP